MYKRTNSLAQKNDAPNAASVFDLSSQGESLQRKVNLVNENLFCDFSTNHSLIQRAKSEHQIYDNRSNKGVLFSLKSDRLPSEEYVMKVSDSFELAIDGLYSVIHALNGPVTPILADSFKFCFGNDLNSCREHVIEVYRKTLEGLIMNKNEIIDLAEDEVSKGHGDPQGYVKTVLGLPYGGIHVNFSLGMSDLIKFIIHESTHYYAGTVDAGYFDVYDIFKALNVKASYTNLGIAMDIGFIVENGVNNADSYANYVIFCMKKL